MALFTSSMVLRMAFNAPSGCCLDFSPLRVSLYEMLVFMFFFYWQLKPHVQNMKKSPSGVYFQSLFMKCGKF